MRANPGKANSGSIATGSTNHLSLVLFERAAGITSVYAPYQGAAPALQALRVGEIDIAQVDLAGALPMIKAGQLTALAVTSASRAAFLPSVPTVAEAGFAGLQSDSVMAIFIPTNVSKEIATLLRDAVNGAIKDAGFQQRMENVGLTPFTAGSETLAELIAAEAATLVPLAKELNIRLD